ncbi:MAG: hypothetical protein ACLQBA_27250 [Candidatus Binataceae bacterium]
MKIKVPFFNALLTAVLAASAHGQQAPPQTQPATGALTDQELAISVHNPF